MSGSEVTLIIDGREVEAIEGTMLVDAAKHGDVEIPVFCYEPKLGPPVGACRMCLVEIEGMPKLQTACSTPVRDGMVVYTRTDQVQEAQNAVVEFLLVNHPLDCPVCDKGGECPLQDIALGWGPGRSRFTDPKRHFRKPLELSPLVAIDRERCILCYRCVRFSQEVAEDEQPQLLERGDRSFVGTFDDRPYVAPFHGNITELCPVGALTNYTYRFRARPWDIEQAGSICTLCPSQCNVSFTVRDERVKRVLARDNPEVDDGWLCDKGRYGFEMLESEARIERAALLSGGNAVPAEWSDAVARAVEGLRSTGAATAALVGDASNEEAYLVQRILREALGSPHVESRRDGGPSRERLLSLSRPELSARVSDIDHADAILVIGTEPLHAAPILDLRIRKAVRRNGAHLVVAGERPSALDGGASASARYAPGGAVGFLAELADAIGSEQGEEGVADMAAVLRAADDVVVIWGERIAQGEGAGEAAAAVLRLAGALGIEDRPESGLLEVPDVTNARGLREAGCIHDAGPGLAEAGAGMDAGGIRAALESGDLKGLLLFGADPIRDYPDSEGWRQALANADFVVSFSLLENESSARADILFPLESHAEKEGTVTHPDGRLQRVRPSAERPGDIRPGWQVLAEIAAGLGHETDISSAPDALAALADAVPFYRGLTDEEIGGRGLRWQDRDAAGALPKAGVGEAGSGTTHSDTQRGAPGGSNGSGAASRGVASEGVRAGDRLLLGTYRDIWAGPVTEHNPPLRFLKPEQKLDIAPADAERLGLSDGDLVSVGENGTGVRAKVAIRERMQPGAVFLIEGTEEGNANVLLGGGPVEVAVTKVEAAEVFG